MNISKYEQRVLHALAQGGVIHAIKDRSGRIIGAECFNREGWLLPECNLQLFKKLRAKRAIASLDGRPHRISRQGLELVRAQANNRG